MTPTTTPETFDREAAMVSLLPLIERAARNEVRRGCPIPREDLVQAAAASLWKDIGKFDPSRGFKLCTWAGKRIVGTMKDYMRQHGQMLSGGKRNGRRERIFDLLKRNIPGSEREADDSFYFDHTDPRSEGDARRRNASESFNDMLRGLTKIERLVCVLRFRDEMLMGEIGKSLGCSERYVSRILARVIERMRERAAT